MLKAGHCYGPFDPVTNIIVNTIWYEATFPPLSQLDELDILGTLNLMRIEAQSFYGLVSFLCTRDKDLNADQAIRFLLNTDLNMTATKHCSSVQEEQETFRAAATAAWHPRPDAQAGFLSSCKTPAVLSLLSDNGGQQQLSSQCVQQLAMLLSSAFHSTGILVQQKQPVAIYKRRLDLTMYEGRIQRRAHRRISRKVKAALSRYEVQNSNQCAAFSASKRGSGLYTRLVGRDSMGTRWSLRRWFAGRIYSKMSTIQRSTTMIAY
uniref:PIR2-like helical domain-containing protein n=1 Tax=Triticum urartu TaxID=4572 RepID=A0A8R7QBI8_TRIUA